MIEFHQRYPVTEHMQRIEFSKFSKCLIYCIFCKFVRKPDIAFYQRHDSGHSAYSTVFDLFASCFVGNVFVVSCNPFSFLCLPLYLKSSFTAIGLMRFLQLFLHFFIAASNCYSIHLSDLPLTEHFSRIASFFVADVNQTRDVLRCKIPNPCKNLCLAVISRRHILSRKFLRTSENVSFVGYVFSDLTWACKASRSSFRSSWRNSLQPFLPVIALKATFLVRGHL